MTFESDWVFLRAALPDLTDYVLSSEVYWTLHPPARLAGGGKLLQLTIGNLMLSQARLAALSLESTQAAELADLSQRIHAVRDSWRANWGIKAHREFGSRLNLWQQYLRELRSETHRRAASYPFEVRKRAILRLLVPEIEEGIQANEDQMLAMLDQILRGISQPGPFVWEPELAGGFPEEGFWFLYVKF